MSEAFSSKTLPNLLKMGNHLAHIRHQVVDYNTSNPPRLQKTRTPDQIQNGGNVQIGTLIATSEMTAKFDPNTAQNMPEVSA